MRTSKAVNHAIFGGFLNLFATGILATTAVVATAGPVSLQDVATMTNTRTAEHNRWLAYLVSIPSGSEHSQVSHGSDEYSLQKPRYVVGVNTTEALHVLDRRHLMETGEPAVINRDMMGDRVFTRGTPAAVAGAYNLTRQNTLVTSGVDRTSLQSDTLMAKAQSFDKLAKTLNGTGDKSPITGADERSSTRKTIADGQMKQARAAARAMAKVADKVRREEVDVASSPLLRSSVSAYAAEDTSMASAFAAVLRPALRKEEEKKAQEKADGKNVLKAAVATLGQSARRAVIRLGRGDHKWAALPLPRSSWSAKQRRCLAHGIYFEARGEPVSGQKAVAQVILNRVKNPAYPKSICGVVYQNKWRRNACQFSFACDGIRDRVKSREHWNVAVKVANDAVDGRFWLKSVGSSSHYHADYVWPKWRRKMRRMTKIGRHIFYRTRGGGWS